MKRLALLLLPLAAFAAAPRADWSPNLTGTVAWHGNLSNGEAVWDRIDALQFGADLLSSSARELGPNDTAHVTLHFAGDWFPRFTKLARGVGGARVDWQHRFGRDALAPVFSIEGAADGVATVESARRGVTGAIELRLAKRFGDTWRAAVSHRFERVNAQNAVFDSGSNETTVEISRDLNEETRITVTGRWREGDVVTYAQYTRPDLGAIAHATARLKTFHEDMTAYATDARTTGGRVALVHATGVDTATVLAYEYAATKRTDLRYENQVISLSFIRQF